MITNPRLSRRATLAGIAFLALGAPLAAQQPPRGHAPLDPAQIQRMKLAEKDTGDIADDIWAAIKAGHEER